MKRIYFSIFFSLLMSACTSRKMPPPVGLISEEEMVSLLVDIRLLEGAYSVEYHSVDTSDYRIDSYYLKLFAESGITKEQFSESYIYYSKQAGKLSELEEEVIERLSELQAKEETE